MKLSAVKCARRARGRGRAAISTEALEVRCLLAGINGSVFNDFSGDGARDAGETGRAGAVVYLDANNNGILDSTVRLFSAVPYSPIRDLTTTTSSINVSGVSGPIMDLDIVLNIAHTYAADLDIFLVGPDGRRIELFTDEGSSHDDFTDLILDDEAAVSINQLTPSFTGRYRPQEALSAFDGTSANGTWTLEIHDDKAGDVGLLAAWTMVVTSATEVTTQTDSQGNYSLTGLSAGTYVVRDVPVAGSVRTSAAAVSVNLPTANSSANAGFGYAAVPAPAGVINGSVVNDFNEDGARDAGETGRAGAVVYLDANNNGTLDSTMRLFSAVPYSPIRDLTTTTSSINVSGVSGPIVDLDIVLNIAHTYAADLDIYLVGPDGRRIELFTDEGSSHDDFTDLILDDEAAVSINQLTPSFTGRYRPQEALSALDGTSANGTWTLEVHDDKAGDLGLLAAWTMVVRSATEATTTTDSQGNYSLTGLSAGTYVVRDVPVAGSVRTSAAAVSVNLPTANSSANASFGYAPAVPPAVVSAFQIDIVFTDNSLTPAQQAIFSAAAARWSQIIVGDIPDVFLSGVGMVDDVRITASAPSIDGIGRILGQAGPTWIRSSSYLPVAGIMEFDSADVASMDANGTLYNVILHEMAHVLGFGTIWDLKGLVTGAGTSNPRYTGAQATAEYRAIFGNSETSIPLENTGGTGTRDSHWRETAFRSELMTGFLSGSLELSRISIAQFADLGYTVSTSPATPYSRPYNSSAPIGAGGTGSVIQFAGFHIHSDDEHDHSDDGHAHSDDLTTSTVPSAVSLASQTTVTVVMMITVTPQATPQTPVIAVPNTVVETPQADNSEAQLAATSEEFREEMVQSAIDSANFMKQSQADILLYGMSDADQAAPSESALNDFLLTPAELDRFFALAAFSA